MTIFYDDTINREPRTVTITSSATPTPNADITDIYTITALAEDATFGAPTGSPVNGQKLIIRILDDDTARSLLWNAAYNAIQALPSTTNASKTLYVYFIYNSTNSKWDLITWGELVGTAQEYQTIYIDAAGMIPCTTSSALQGTNEYGTNDIDIDYFAFDAGATEERVQFKLKMPENWDRGTIKAKFDWSSASGSTAGDTVEWGIKAGALSNDDAIDAALGTPQVISDILLADNGTDLQTTSATPALTIAGSPAINDIIVFEIYRNTDGTDDMAEDAWLFGVTLQIKLSGIVNVW